MNTDETKTIPNDSLLAAFRFGLNLRDMIKDPGDLEEVREQLQRIRDGIETTSCTAAEIAPLELQRLAMVLIREAQQEQRTIAGVLLTELEAKGFC